LPRDRLLLGTARQLLLPGLLGTLSPLLLDPLLLLRPLLLLLGPLLLLRPLLLLLGSLLLRLVLLGLRALLLGTLRRTFLLPTLLILSLALLFGLLAALRVRRDNRPEKQAQGSGTGRPSELHSHRPPLKSPSDGHADGPSGLAHTLISGPVQSHYIPLPHARQPPG
jgi:hypothetical protein